MQTCLPLTNKKNVNDPSTGPYRSKTHVEHTQEDQVKVGHLIWQDMSDILRTRPRGKWLTWESDKIWT